MSHHDSNPVNHIARIESTKRSVRKYLGIIAIFVTLVLAGVFFAVQFNVLQTLPLHLHQQARAFFGEIVTVRKWVAKHGGVYVPLDKTSGINPYLESVPGIKTTIACDNGPYVLKNPSLVTKELSD